MSYFNETSGQELVKEQNGADEPSFSQDEFSFLLVDAPTNFSYNSLKADCCYGEDVFGRSLGGFLENPKGVGMFQNCLQNENGDLFPRSTLG